jgi:hypothetical protein
MTFMLSETYTDKAANRKREGTSGEISVDDVSPRS